MWPLFIRRIVSVDQKKTIYDPERTKDNPILAKEWLAYLKGYWDRVDVFSSVGEPFTKESLTAESFESGLLVAPLSFLVEGVTIEVSYCGHTDGHFLGELEVSSRYYDEDEEDEELRKIGMAVRRLADDFSSVVLVEAVEVAYMSHPIPDLKIGDIV